MSTPVKHPERLVRNRFWPKVRKTLGRVPFVPDAVALYYCMIDRETPVWAKAAIAGALAYFIVPTDLLPDFIGVLGYTDDAAVVAATLKTIRQHLRPEHYRKAWKALEH